MEKFSARKFLVGALCFILIVTLMQMGATNVSADNDISGVSGFGENTVGGNGGVVYEVTNLNDSGIGSLRECVNASGARYCIFRTGGTIELLSPLVIANPYITIAGQTASGGGITIKGEIKVMASEVIIMFVTVRPYPNGENHGIQIGKNNAEISNIVLNFVSASWGVDSTTETWYRAVNVTIANSIFAESLNCSVHSKGCHSKGVMLGGYKMGETNPAFGSERISFVNNLIANGAERNPLIKAHQVEVVGNVIFNSLYSFSAVDMDKMTRQLDVHYFNNTFIRGLDTAAGSYPINVNNVSPYGARIYLYGNRVIDLNGNISENVSDIVKPSVVPYLVSSPLFYSLEEGNGANPEEMLLYVGNSSGLDCDGNYYYRRDGIDTRIVSEVEQRTGRIIDDPSEVGGWETIEQGTPCADDNHDGVPNGYIGSLNDYLLGVQYEPTPTPTDIPTLTPTWTPRSICVRITLGDNATGDKLNIYPTNNVLGTPIGTYDVGETVMALREWGNYGEFFWYRTSDGYSKFMNNVTSEGYGVLTACNP